MSDWRPISSAPMDETAILAWSKYHGQMVVWWLNDTPSISGWAAGESLIYPSAVFTHWQPLPEPPPT